MSVNREGIWGKPDEDEITEIAVKCGEIWDVAHMSVRKLRERVHIGQSELSRKFCVPLRTVQDWAHGNHVCPRYVILMMARLLGLI